MSSKGQQSLQDQMLFDYISRIFDKYDLDKNGVLDPDELVLFFTDMLKALKQDHEVSKEAVHQSIKQMDENSDGMIDKGELFRTFKAILLCAQDDQWEKQKKSFSNLRSKGNLVTKGNFKKSNF